jgi:hypothetical protein
VWSLTNVSQPNPANEVCSKRVVAVTWWLSPHGCLFRVTVLWMYKGVWTALKREVWVCFVTFCTKIQEHLSLHLFCTILAKKYASILPSYKLEMWLRITVRCLCYMCQWSWLILRCYPSICCKDWGKLWNTSVLITRLWTENWSRDPCLRRKSWKRNLGIDFIQIRAIRKESKD